MSLSIGSALSQHLLVNIRIQAYKEERIETDFPLEGIQFRSRPALDEGIPDRAFENIRPVTIMED